MSSATQVETPTLGVCQGTNSSVTQRCAHCGLRPATKKFCSSVCRQAAYRLSPAHRKNLDEKIVTRREKRNRWVAAKNRDKSFGFDGRYGGHVNPNVPSLGNFEKFSAEAYLVKALQEVREEIGAR